MISFSVANQKVKTRIIVINKFTIALGFFPKTCPVSAIKKYELTYPDLLKGDHHFFTRKS